MEFRQLCILPDANVWIKTGLLSDSLGFALSYYCGSMGVRLGLPEVVEREIHRNALRLGRESCGRIRDSYRRLRLFGFATPIKTPSDAEIEQHVAGRLAELEPYIERVPFTLEHARGALDRVLDQSPPNSANNQQFKDSAIWEAALALCTRYAVRLVTADKAFYANQIYSQGLPDRLLADIAGEFDLVTYSDLESLLVAVQETSTVPNYSEVARRITATIQPEVERVSEERGLTIRSTLDTRLNALPTADGDVLALGFQARFLAAAAVGDPTGEGRSTDVIVKGSCSLLVREGELELHEVRLSEVTLDDGLVAQAILLGNPSREETT